MNLEVDLVKNCLEKAVIGNGEDFCIMTQKKFKLFFEVIPDNEKIKLFDSVNLFVLKKDTSPEDFSGEEYKLLREKGYILFKAIKRKFVGGKRYETSYKTFINKAMEEKLQSLQ